MGWQRVNYEGIRTSRCWSGGRQCACRLCKKQNDLYFVYLTSAAGYVQSVLIWLHSPLQPLGH